MSTSTIAKRSQQDEYLEQLWYMKESGKCSMYFLKKAMNEAFDQKVLAELCSEGLAQTSPDGANINLTSDGEARASYLIRAHRLAERLLHDVMGGEFETGACEFEHTVSLALVDSICTLLGHPRECPHGLPIPEGECCKRSANTELSFIIPITSLKLGQSARIAHINCRNDQDIHRLEGLSVRPGAVAKLHQNYPAYVIECEGATIALDKEIANNICVFKGLGTESPAKKRNDNNKSNSVMKAFNLFFKKSKDKRGGSA